MTFPKKLTDIIRQSNDVCVLDAENDDYVPEEEGVT